MGRLIEVDKVIEIIDKKQRKLFPNGRYGRHYVYENDREMFNDWEEMLKEIDKIPAIDAELVRHGRIIGKSHELFGECGYCSVCRKINRADTKYCQWCGAKMDAGMKKEELMQVAKPILFNTEMVRAVLDRRKTETRLLVKPHHLRVLVSPYHKEHPEVPDKVLIEKLCEPPYKPGDYLYVRETWNGLPADRICPAEFWYKADEEILNPDDKWRPSIHMPKEAARIFLRVTDVRVERLQEIMNDPPGPKNKIVREGCDYGCDFIAIWESAIKPKDRGKYGWDANPWVWVIEFERVEVR